MPQPRHLCPTPAPPGMAEGMPLARLMPDPIV